MRGLALVVLMMIRSPAFAQLCVVPVIDGQPTEEPELTQPYRMAAETLTITGYPHLVIRPSNHKGLYTVEDGHFRPLFAQFPKVGWWQFRQTHMLSDGRVFALGRNPDVIFVLDDQEGVFLPIAETEGYRVSYFDTEKDVLWFSSASGALMQIGPDGPVAVTMPQIRERSRETPLPRYVEAFGGYIAATDFSLWYLRDGATDWVELLTRGTQNHLWTTASSPEFTVPILVDADQNLAYMTYRSGAAVFDIATGAPHFLYFVEHPSDAAQVNGRIIVKQKNYRQRWFGGGFDTLSPLWPDLFVLGRDGPEPVQGMPDQIDTSGNPLLAYNLRYVPAWNRAIVWINESWIAFDGTRLLPIPSLADQPSYLGPIEIQGQGLLKASGSYFNVGDSLEIESIQMPQDDLSRYYASDTFGGTFFYTRYSDKLWFTRDLRSFEQVTLPPDVQISDVKSDLPDAPATLAIGTNGLYLIQHCEGANP